MKNTTTTTTTTNTTNTNGGKNMNTNKPDSMVIPFKAIALKNERCTLYDIRMALIDENDPSLLSLVKAWIHAKDNGIVADNDGRTTCEYLKKVAYVGKYASVNGRKDGKDGFMDVVSSGRVKAWLYTLRRNSYKGIDVIAEKGDRPEEKQVKQVNRKTTVKITAEDKEMFELIKKFRDAGMSKEQMEKLFNAMAC